MSLLTQRRKQVVEAEARLERSSERLRQSWSDLKQESSAALTPGRVVVGGLLSGYFSGMLAGSRSANEAFSSPGDSGKGFSLLLALIQLGSTLLPQLLPSLAPAFRAGVAAGAGTAPDAPTATPSEDHA